METNGIYLNGELTVDFPEDIKIPLEPNQMVTAQLVGSKVQFSYCGLGDVIGYLKEQYAVGMGKIKIVQPKIYKNLIG